REPEQHAPVPDAKRGLRIVPLAGEPADAVRSIAALDPEVCHLVAVHRAGDDPRELHPGERALSVVAHRSVEREPETHRPIAFEVTEHAWPTALVAYEPPLFL